MFSRMRSILIYIYIYILIYNNNNNCKNAFWIPSPNDKRSQVQRAQYNEFVESELENQVLMSWITVRMDLEDNKVKVDKIYLRKFVLGTVRGDQFLHIILEVGYRYNFDCYSVSFSILRSLSLRVSLLFYTTFPFHLYPSHANQIVGVGPYPISTFLKSLGNSWKVENYCSGIISSLMQPKSQLQSIQCGGSSFSLDISQLSSVMFLSNTYTLIHGMVWNVALYGKPHLLTLALLSLGDIPPRTPSQAIMIRPYLFTYQHKSL